jgi:peroxiredoxin
MWTSADSGPGETTLKGTRAMERHTLVLGKSPRLHVRSWELARSIPAAEGKTVQQVYTCEVTLDPATGEVQRLREWVVSPLAGGSAASRDTTIKKSESIAGSTPPSLAVPLPPGALVADARNGSPVEYELMEPDPGDGPPPLTTNLQKPAPDFEVRGTEKKPFKLADYRRKPLLLVWISAGSAPVASAADALDAFSEEYRKKGIQFLALEVSTSSDAAREAEAFRKRSGWSFPVALDPGGALLSQFGLPRALPAVALVDADGKIVYGRAGLDPTTLSAALDVVKK